MTAEDINELKEETALLRAAFEKVMPVKKDGTFDSEKVKAVTCEMIDLAFKDEEKAARFKDWMEKHEYWTSPASTRFHGNLKGGLAAHSLLVAYEALVFAVPFAENFMTCKMADSFSYSAFDILVSGLAHDFCKAGAYMTEYRKTKDYSGNMVYSGYYKTKPENRNIGHGNESVLLVLESLPELLQKRYVIEAISRHMGFSDLSDMERMNYSNFLQNPLVLLIQTADQTAASWWDV